MKFTIICHLAAFYLCIITDKKVAKWEIIVNFMFSCECFKINMKYNIIAESNLVQLNFENNSYNVSSIVFSMLSLGRILISDVLVA